MTTYGTDVKVEDLDVGMKITFESPAGDYTFLVKDDVAAELVEQITYIIGDIQA